jgi:flagellar hook-associated protein 1 FlgK
MADLLNTSISGLLAFQRALDTTSHNITNANTVGYSRQLPEFMTRQAQQSSGGWVGNGVDVSTIKRAYDNFLSTQARTSSSSYNQANTYATQAGRISNLLGDSTTGLSASLQKFVNAMQSVADTPTSIPARQTLLTQAQTLVDRLKGYQQSLESFDAQVNAALEGEADTVTSIARGIAQLNQQITNGYAQTGQPPNDLLDQRDRLIDELATHINVNVVEQDDRSVNVFIGAGQPLVVGQTPATVVTSADPYDPTRNVIAVRSAHGEIDITNSLSGGVMGGMLDFRRQMLDPARNTLGRMSVAVTEVMNEQHRAGMDLNGDLGEDFFAVGGVGVHSHSGNTGTSAAAVTRVNGAAGALTTSDYLMTYTAGGWALRRADTGAAVTMTGTGTAADPFLADGLSIVVSGAPAVGDRLLIQPTADAVSGMRVLITDASEIAAAAPIVSAETAGNRGSGVISAGEVIDATDPQLRSPVSITFTSPTQYTVSGDPTVYTYTAGADIDVNGWRVQITGSPAAGDSFTVSDNLTGDGDNRNALKLAAVMTQPVMNGGTTSLNAGAGQFVGEVGVKTNQAQVTRDAQKVVADEAASALQSVSGVNLDEEAANLIRYQQAYMAIAQMIRVADTVFQSVLDATRG